MSLSVSANLALPTLTTSSHTHRAAYGAAKSSLLEAGYQAVKRFWNSMQPASAVFSLNTSQKRRECNCMQTALMTLRSTTLTFGAVSNIYWMGSPSCS